MTTSPRTRSRQRLRTPLAERFGVEVPVFAFSYEPAVVAAVSRAGGLGVLGALRFTPEELDEALTYLERELGGRPYGVDIVMPFVSEQVDAADFGELTEKLTAMIPAAHRRFVDDVLDRYQVPDLPPDAPEVRGVLGWTDLSARAQVDVVFKHRPALLANALGPPPPDVVERSHAQGVPVAALVGTAAQARKQAAADVDVVVAQGTEAGGHTGEIATFVLVPEVVDAVAPRPVLAAGGIGRGRQIAAALALGAQGVWTGSVWLTTEEHPMSQVLRDKLLAATSRDTVRSRAMTGKPARQLRTAWTDAWDDPESPGPLAMPLQYLLTAEAQRRILAAEQPDLLGMPVGQIVGAMDAVRPVAAVMEDLITECADSLDRLCG